MRSALALAVAAFALGVVTASCDRCAGADERKDAAGDVPDAAPPAADAASVNVRVDAGATDHAAASLDASSDAGDAGRDAATSATSNGGPSLCRLAYGPAEQPFRGPAALVIAPSELRLVANDMGKPRIYPVPLGPPPRAPAKPIVTPPPSSFAAMRWPACEVAGPWAYCQAAGGIVYRTTLGGTDTKRVAKARGSTRIAAAPLGHGHAIVATLDSRRTSEGEVLQAFVTLDEGETVRLSDEGAGATVVRLAPRGDRAVAVYLDARTSMVPVHARTVARSANGAPGSGDLALAEDAVIYVGGPPERGIDVAVAGAGRAQFALLPIGRDAADFGLAALPIADPPKHDVAPVWSAYPNGLDPAPIAATVADYEADGGAAAGAWIARVRTRESAAGAPRVLELGRLDAAGVFTSLGTIATGVPITDVAIAADPYGAVWILYGDTTATWLERRVCP